MVNARMRVTKLETALGAVGQEDPTHPILFEALQHARSQAQFLCRIGSRGRRCSSSARRNGCEGAQKVLDEAEAKKHEEGRIREGERRLAALLQEAEVSPAAQFSQPPPTVSVDCAAEVAQLRACVEELKAERNELRSRLTMHLPNKTGSIESEWDSPFRDDGDHDRQCFIKPSRLQNLDAKICASPVWVQSRPQWRGIESRP